MGLSRQEYWCGLPCPPARDLPNPGIEPRSPVLVRQMVRQIPYSSEPPGKPQEREFCPLSSGAKLGKGNKERPVLSVCAIIFSYHWAEGAGKIFWLPGDFKDLTSFRFQGVSNPGRAGIPEQGSHFDCNLSSFQLENDPSVLP